MPRGGNNSWQNAGRRELLRGMQEPRRGRPLGPLSKDLSPEMTAWVTRLREFYTSLGMTLTELEHLVGVDASTLSRYLNGRRLPEITFLHKLDDAVHSRQRARMQPDVRDSVRQLYLAACLVHEPQRHEVYVLRDALAEAEERAKRAEETVWDLQAELKAEQRRRELVEAGLHQLEAHVGAVGDLVALQRERAQAIAERDLLTALVQQHAEELASALREQYAIAQVRNELANALQTAEQALNDRLESQWASPEPPPAPPQPSRRRWPWPSGRRRARDSAGLQALREGAERAARELPALVERLSTTDPREVDLSFTSVGEHSDEDIGQVAAAIDAVLGEAVRLAAEQALLRGNINEIFTSLSRRSQVLIHRQLSLLSELESREEDPEQLSSLFKLDHLATRMQRNSENLLVLAGHEPSRRWTTTVPLVDVLRAAAAEVEQYERIELASIPSIAVVGRMVNDFVHLLAELLDNATAFSPPDTPVRVTAHALPDGRLLTEIHDVGLGFGPEQLDEFNARLADPPMVDASVSHRMGLFVVGRLSLRYGIRVQLRHNDGGGAIALVTLPATAVAAE